VLSPLFITHLCATALPPNWAPQRYPKLGPSTELFVVPATFGSAMGCSDPSDKCEDLICLIARLGDCDRAVCW